MKVNLSFDANASKDREALIAIAEGMKSLRGEAIVDETKKLVAPEAKAEPKAEDKVAPEAKAEPKEEPKVEAKVEAKRPHRKVVSAKLPDEPKTEPKAEPKADQSTGDAMRFDAIVDLTHKYTGRYGQDAKVLVRKYLKSKDLAKLSAAKEKDYETIYTELSETLSQLDKCTNEA